LEIRSSEFPDPHGRGWTLGRGVGGSPGGWWQSADVGRRRLQLSRACMPIFCFACCRSCLVLCARCRSSVSAGFSTCTAGRSGPLPIVHELRSADVGRCRVLWCGVIPYGIPGRAGAPGGSCDASGARVVRCRAQSCMAGACRPLWAQRRLWPYAAVRSLWACWRLLCGRGRMVSPIACTCAGRPSWPTSRRVHELAYPWKSARYSSWSASWSGVICSSSATPLSSIP
jgi:hypothetical protein